jgi:hypothetical protein
MTPEQALKVCLDTLEKIAEANGCIEATSLMDWRRKVMVMAERTHAQASKALRKAHDATPVIPLAAPERRY